MALALNIMGWYGFFHRKKILSRIFSNFIITLLREGGASEINVLSVQNFFSLSWASEIFSEIL